MSFWLAFPWWLVMLSTFTSSCWPFECFLWNNIYSDPLLIFNWIFLLVYEFSVCFGYSLLIRLYGLQIFTTVLVCYPFILLMVFFAMQKVFNLMWFYLFTFAFVAKSKKSLLRPLSRSLPPRFSFRRFMVSGLTFKSLIHLELILAYCIRWRCKSSWLQQYFEVYSV